MTTDLAVISLPTLVYKDDKNPDEVHEAAAAALRQGPIALGPYGIPEVLSHNLVRTVLRDSRFVTPKGLGLVMQDITSGPIWDRVSKWLIGLDGDEHRRLRRLVAKAFTPRTAERMRGACVDVMTALVDRHVGAGSFDFVAEIAKPYPVAIICSLLGAPWEDWQLLTGWVANITRALGLRVVGHERAILEAFEGLEAYVEELVAARRQSLTDDLISELIRAEDQGERLTHDELVSLAVFLFVVGTDTLRYQLAGAVQALADHPDQWELLAERPELAPQAVNELMRHMPVLFKVLRQASVDVELGGVHFPAGSFVVANLAAANRDPSVYDDPDRLDITREGAPAMLSFGGGAHYCLGVHLARIELTEALRVITAKVANPRRTGPAPWKGFPEITGPTTLPIEFDAKR